MLLSGRVKSVKGDKIAMALDSSKPTGLDSVKVGQVMRCVVRRIEACLPKNKNCPRDPP